MLELLNQAGLVRGLKILNKYPHFIMGVLPPAKNDDALWKQKFHSANGRAQHALKVP